MAAQNQRKWLLFVAQSGTIGEQLGQIGFDFPDFALVSASEGWRVERDETVSIFAAQFALDKLFDVINDPADGGGNTRIVSEVFPLFLSFRNKVTLLQLIGERAGPSKCRKILIIADSG